jgi:hypothetical protein
VDKELQKYYEDRFSMMATQGWSDLAEDVKKIYDAVNNLAPVQNELDLFFRKGQLDILQWMLTLRESSAQAYEQLQNSSGDASDAS